MALDLLRNVRDVLAGGTAGATLGKIVQFVRFMRKTGGCVPRGSFDASRCGAPPDYDRLDAWLAHPDRPAGLRDVEDANHLGAAGAAPPAVDARPCDCFFVVDTCFNAAESIPFVPDSAARRWNLPVGAEEGSAAHQLVDKVVEQMEMRVAAGASCFNRSCRIYAPLYRQASILAMTTHTAMLLAALKAGKTRPLPWPSEELWQCFDLAYGDVLRAFEKFVDDPSRADRPFILAGHSQGTLHLVRLLQEQVENHPRRRARFVHAYLAGYAVPADLFSRTLRHVRPCAHAADVRSVSSWNTLPQDHAGHDLFRNMGVAWYSGEGWRPVTGELLATSPITWASGGPGAAPSAPSEYKGALWPMPDGCDPRESESGAVPSGVALRYGHTVARSRQRLGLRVRELVPVDCGELTAQADQHGFVRVPRFPPESLFSLIERDWLLYHDVDCAAFHANLQENVALRIRAWQPRSRL